MSWAEEQSWFGLEDLVFDVLNREDEIEFIQIPAWRTKEGKLIAIRDMETSHIKNCIKMILRSHYQWRSQYLNLLKLELIRRNEKIPSL